MLESINCFPHTYRLLRPRVLQDGWEDARGSRAMDEFSFNGTRTLLALLLWWNNWNQSKIISPPHKARGTVIRFRQFFLALHVMRTPFFSILPRTDFNCQPSDGWEIFSTKGFIVSAFSSRSSFFEWSRLLWMKMIEISWEIFRFLNSRAARAWMMKTMRIECFERNGFPWDNVAYGNNIVHKWHGFAKRTLLSST